MKYKSLLITGTDTGIGKTTVACMLAAGLRRRGLRVGVSKPAETGRVEILASPSGLADSQALAYFAGCEAPFELVCPYWLDEPLAPLVASRRQGVPIDMERIVSCVRRIEDEHDVTLVEGAGGLLVPLAEGATFVDLARRLSCAVIVVVGNRLGAINHALLTLEHAQARGLHVLGYVLNTLSPRTDVAAETNLAILTELAGSPLGVVPYVEDRRADDDTRAMLAGLATSTLELERFLCAV